MWYNPNKLTVLQRVYLHEKGTNPNGTEIYDRGRAAEICDMRSLANCWRFSWEDLDGSCVD